MPHSTDTQLFQLDLGRATAYPHEAIAAAFPESREETSARLEAALAPPPDGAEAQNNLGNFFYYQERYDDAIQSYQRALSLKPDCAEAYSNLANTLSALGRFEAAVASCQQALRFRPEYARAYNNLGNACQGLGRLEEAVICYEQALRLNPEFAEVRSNLGIALAGLNRMDEAVAQCREALRLKPDYCDAHYQLGIAFINRTNWQDAEAALRQAVRYHPNYVDPYYNLGFVLCEQGKLAEAENCFRQALQIQPDCAQAHWALAYIGLVQGDFERAWPEQDKSRLLKGSSRRAYHQPSWNGSPLEGRTILLHAEGGLGDTIQLVRYAAVVERYGGTVVLECQKSLIPLLSKCPGIDRIVAAGSALPPFDAYASLLSCPRIVKTSLSTIPAEIPYLWADPKSQRKWRKRLSRYPGFKIGIVWQGNPQHHRDFQRSIPLIQFAPLSRIPGVCLFSLQKGPGQEQLQAVAGQFHVVDFGAQLDEESGAFMDTAAVMKSLDLVISADTAVAHVAGALGVPVWVALAFMPDWRWLLHREDTPWYPTMRLFRQTKPGDWDGVFARMAEELPKKWQGVASYNPSLSKSLSHR
jgi:tetratricopeptide (TPR) repeat protein